MIKWERKTSEFRYAPYVSNDGRFIVADINSADNSKYVPEYREIKINHWGSKEAHNKFLNYCKENNISLNGPAWVLVDNETGKRFFPFKTAISAKMFAEEII